jgi:hypothetical protein
MSYSYHSENIQCLKFRQSHRGTERKWHAYISHKFKHQIKVSIIYQHSGDINQSFIKPSPGYAGVSLSQAKTELSDSNYFVHVSSSWVIMSLYSKFSFLGCLEVELLISDSTLFYFFYFFRGVR